ncbi:uncharacterized protein LOC124166058 [Ischnura elegans]|uniref:uncharacterized protein LOC124166058 n=1 Tax=Ischnura elegans TaxID=197161 RepID=UPI001ED8813B|nr:uncharacterized protein LOC124166058 [Ischnura elegans]
MELLSTGNEAFRQLTGGNSTRHQGQRSDVPYNSGSTTTRIVSSYTHRGQCDFDYYVKLPLLITSTLCAALQSTIPASTERNYVLHYLPRVIFFEYIFLNAYIILMYKEWYRLKKVLKQLHGVLGCLLYLAAGVMVILNRQNGSHSSKWPTTQIDTTSGHELHWRSRMGTTNSVAFLAFFEAILHLLDVVIGSF